MRVVLSDLRDAGRVVGSILGEALAFAVFCASMAGIIACLF